MKYFFDTSALVKLFQVEKGSEIVEEIVNDPDNDLWVQLMNEYAKEYGLRSLDALHLAACRILQSKDWYFVCADNRLCNIAKLCKINVLNPVEGF